VVELFIVKIYIMDMMNGNEQNINSKPNQSKTFCTTCGESVDGTAFCTGCGTPVPKKVMFCTSCGAKLNENEVFCTDCGTPVDNPTNIPVVMKPVFNSVPTSKNPNKVQHTQSVYPQEQNQLPIYKSPPKSKRNAKMIITLIVIFTLLISAGVFVFIMYPEYLGIENLFGHTPDIQRSPDSSLDYSSDSSLDPSPEPSPDPTPDIDPVQTPDVVDISVNDSGTGDNGNVTIIIPKIVITTRYNPTRREFGAQDAHAQSVEAAGGIPVQAVDDRMLSDLLRTGDTSNVDAIAELYDGLILTGGGDISARFFGQTKHPESSEPDETRDVAEIELCRAFINAGKPVFGINRGMQVINVAMGGDLIQDIPDLMDIDSSIHSGNTTHIIDIMQGSWLYTMFGSSIRTSSNHHQAVGILADGFTVAAQTGPVIEAIENGNTLGIQFNPDRSGANVSSPIFKDFITRCSHIQSP